MELLHIFCLTRRLLQQFSFSLEDEGNMSIDYQEDNEGQTDWFDRLIFVIQLLPSLRALGIAIPELSKHTLTDSLTRLTDVLPTYVEAIHVDIFVADDSSQELYLYSPLVSQCFDIK